MCYEPLRFSPIFRRFVNSRESRVGLPLTPLNLTTKSVCALAQSSLFCGVCLIALRSLAHSHKQHPPLCVFYTLSTKTNTPLISSTTSRLEVPSRGLHKNPTPGQHPAVGHTRTHPYRIYRAPVRLWRGCSALSLSSCVSSLACQARERARALPSLSSSFCLAVSHPITGTRLQISLYREASMKRSDPVSLIVSRSVD